MQKLGLVVVAFILLATAIAARPVRSLPGTVITTPAPVTAAASFVISGVDIPDDGSGAVWLKIAGDPETCTAGTTYTGDLLDDGNTFTKPWTLYKPCVYTLDVYEGFGGPRAKKLATTTFTVQ